MSRQQHKNIMTKKPKIKPIIYWYPFGIHFLDTTNPVPSKGFSQFNKNWYPFQKLTGYHKSSAQYWIQPKVSKVSTFVWVLYINIYTLL